MTKSINKFDSGKDKDQQQKEYDEGLVSQINSMINPDSTLKGRFSIHDPLSQEFLTKIFKETDCKVDSLSVPEDFDMIPVIEENKEEI